MVEQIAIAGVRDIHDIARWVLIGFTLIGGWWALSEPTGGAYEVIGRVVVGVIVGFFVGLGLLLLFGVGWSLFAAR